ncbi:hypothetical protein Vlu01_15730 [Micromonospora lutea]|uniref:Uncharacterized protein n=1 Tax=Micromonospora lutea TaxID=419825 RepID=A0ABQ4ISQ5_9ACTN|nr:hypothetical protein Vlu01_15730 [Micromonospora lutea]
MRRLPSGDSVGGRLSTYGLAVPHVRERQAVQRRRPAVVVAGKRGSGLRWRVSRGAARRRLVRAEAGDRLDQFPFLVGQV